MSKLFNTLEKIRHHETSSPPPAKKAAAKRKTPADRPFAKRWLGLLLTGLAALLVLYTALLANRLDLVPLSASIQKLATTLHLLPASRQTAVDRQAGSVPTAPAVPAGSDPLASTTQHAVKLNNTGAELLQNGDYWRSIYCFEQARRAMPAAVEPVINMAVALSELGLYGPANRLFQEARQLDPENPQLRANLALLAEAGRLDDSLEAVTAGGSTPSPKGR